MHEDLSERETHLIPASNASFLGSKLNAAEGGDEGGPEAGSTPVFCPLLNVSSCPTSEASEAFTVTLYNPLARPRSFHARVPVPGGVGYKVTDHQGQGTRTTILMRLLHLDRLLSLTYADEVHTPAFIYS